MESSAVKFVPNIHSGSHSDTGSRDSMDDEHIRIDDQSAHVGPRFKCPFPSAFYAVFDGHGGPEAAAYIKRNAMRLFFEDADLPQRMDMDAVFFRELENSHRKAFLLADHALADEQSVRSSCGTTALTALILGRHLMVANAGDCLAVLCRKGIAVDMSQDHRPSYLPERMRVEQLGGYIDDGYLNGSISVTRVLGDWGLKLPLGSSLPLIAEPDVQQCDKELVKEALRLNTSDNLTVIVVRLSTPEHVEFPRQRPRLRTCSLSEEARSRLRSLLEGN
ncbi:hypothetical protein ACFX2I_021698 [Malus domestica]